MNFGFFIFRQQRLSIPLSSTGIGESKALLIFLKIVVNIIGDGIFY
nr:hypothetical protein [Bacillus thuringiensis]